MTQQQLMTEVAAGARVSCDAQQWQAERETVKPVKWCGARASPLTRKPCVPHAGPVPRCLGRLAHSLAARGNRCRPQSCLQHADVENQHGTPCCAWRQEGGCSQEAAQGTSRGASSPPNQCLQSLRFKSQFQCRCHNQQSAWMTGSVGLACCSSCSRCMRCAGISLVWVRVRVAKAC